VKLVSLVASTLSRQEIFVSTIEKNIMTKFSDSSLPSMY